MYSHTQEHRHRHTHTHTHTDADLEGNIETGSVTYLTESAFLGRATERPELEPSRLSPLIALWKKKEALLVAAVITKFTTNTQ